MKNKIIGIFVVMLMITTCVIPTLGECIAQSTGIIKDNTYVPLKDAAFDLKISFLMKIAGYPSRNIDP
jgi:hypothetical protein